MYVLRIELVIIEFLESLARHVPYPIASRLEPLADHWRARVKAEMVREIEGMKKDVKLIQRVISEMKSATHKIKSIQQKSDKK